jgi:type IV pilus assembly protein PilA
MRKERGFSLIELLVVVAVIGLIAAIAVPNLTRARQSAYSASAIQSMRTLTTAQVLYERKYRKYATLAFLAPEGTLDPYLATGAKGHYNYLITLSADELHYTITASPIIAPTEMTYYFTDESTVIRYNVGALADINSDPIPK